MNIMKSFRQNSRGGRSWALPAIIVQSVAARYTPPQNPRGFLQIMQALNVADDQVGAVGRQGLLVDTSVWEAATGQTYFLSGLGLRATVRLRGS